MRNKKLLLLLVLGIVLGISSKNNLLEYYYCKKAEKQISKSKYDLAIENYKKALSVSGNKKIVSNIIKTLYMNKNYEEIIKLENDENFIKGNTYVYLSNENNNQYKEALDNYRKEMLEKDTPDINVKKNYEIIYNLLNQKNQDDKQNQENKNSDKNSQNQEKNKRNSEDNSQENKETSNEKEKNQENQESKDKKNKDKENNSSNQNNTDNEENKNTNSQTSDNKTDKKDKTDNLNKNENNNENSENSEMDKIKNTSKREKDIIKQAEIKAILQRMETEEKQAFKNNERVMYKTNPNNNKNSW